MERQDEAASGRDAAEWPVMERGHVTAAASDDWQPGWANWWQGFWNEPRRADDGTNPGPAGENGAAA